MSERCELCGAKSRPEDETCRECGAVLPRDPMEEPDSSAHVTAVEEAIPVQESALRSPPAETNPELRVDDFPEPRRTPWLAIAGVAVLVGGGAFAFAQSSGDDTSPPPAPSQSEAEEQPAAEPPPAATPDCDELEALQGHWAFTTEVTGSRVVQSSGLNGFYTLDVTTDGCSATAALTKTGYTARTFTEARIQRGTSPLVPAEGVRAGLFTATFELASEVGAHGTTEFSFSADGDTLSGVYRQRGSRWTDAGLSGFLHGARDTSTPRDLDASSEPCLVRCQLACDTAVREAVETDPIRACVDACEQDDATPARCGDVQALPSEYSLDLEGPAKISALCKGIGGCAKKIGRAHPQAPRLAADRLPAGWSEAVMLRGKREGGVRLALHGDAGWWLSAPLFDVPGGTRLGKLRLYARQLSEGEDRRYVLGLARMGATDDTKEAYVACRLEDAPTCVRVLRTRGTHVSGLPEGNLSVSAQAADPSGVFHW